MKMKRMVGLLAGLLTLLSAGAVSANTYEYRESFGGLVDKRCPRAFSLELFTKPGTDGFAARVCALEDAFSSIVEPGCVTYCPDFDRTVSSIRWMWSSGGDWLCLYEGVGFTGEYMRLGPWNGFPRVVDDLLPWGWNNQFRSAKLC